MKTLSLGSLLGDLESHPGRLLKDHLMGTWQLAKALSGRNCVPVDEEHLKWVCLTHDLGKAKKEFQRYLQKKGGKVFHAEISAWFTFSATCDLICAEAVRKHHSKIDSFADISNYWANDDFDVDEVNETISSLLPNWSFAVSQSLLDDLYDRLLPTEQILDMSAQDLAYVHDWLRLKTIYSLFVTADRMDAMGIRRINMGPIPEWKPKVFPSNAPLAEWRSRVRQECLKKAETVSLPGIFTLTLPTGSGKTLIGLEMAYKWAKKMNLSNIIYALPFISIVEQNAQVASEVFGKDNVQEDHSLAYVKEDEKKKGKQEKDEEDLTPERRMQSFFRYWDAPVTVTTLVQLWTSLFSPHANDSMNFHRLSNSVVIMDEPQTIDPQLWKEFGETLSFLSRKLNTTFLFMTATQPHIVEGEELAPKDADKGRPSRYKCRFIPGVYSIKDLPDLLEKNVSKLDKGPGLIVMNTRKSALEAYNMLKDRLMDEGPVLFLSTWVAPKHRREILKKLISLEKEGVKRYLISTQVVEAGVDLDFEWVFRDLGPLDSIIQVAGRCNRHFLDEENAGEVVVAELMNPEDKNCIFGSYIYDPVLLQASRKTLSKYPEFDEKETAKMIDEYFRCMLDNLNHEPIWSRIQQGIWDDLPKLIKQDKQKNSVTVYVELDDELQPLLKELEAIEKGLENIDRAKRIARQLEMYKIEVDEKFVAEWEQKLHTNIVIEGEKHILRSLTGRDVWFLSKEGIGIVYSMDVGFMPLDKSNVDSLL
ncbi:CRISPR-associated helicase Cas3' [Thermovirga lienii]|uniref:CRISPR-associated helicase Cas3' n=1 Tax=Thermovirga lienii TaxID=336261 RepID=UPI002FDF3428